MINSHSRALYAQEYPRGYSNRLVAFSYELAPLWCVVLESQCGSLHDRAMHVRAATAELALEAANASNPSWNAYYWYQLAD